MIGIVISIIIGIYIDSFNRIFFFFENHTYYDDGLIFKIPIDKLIHLKDIAVLISIIILFTLLVYLYHREGLALKNSQLSTKIETMKQQIEQIGGTLVYQVSNTLDMSLEHILKELCRMIVENSNIVISCSTYSYVESHHSSKVTFIVDNLAHHTLFDTRSNVIAREIYEFNNSLYTEFMNLHSKNDHLEQMMLSDLANHHSLNSIKELTQEHIENVEPMLDKIYSKNTKKSQEQLVNESYQLFNKIQRKINNPHSISVIEKHYCSNCIKLKENSPQTDYTKTTHTSNHEPKNIYIDEVLEVKREHSTLRAMLNAVLLYASSEIGSNGLNENLEYELRRIQRTGIMTFILLDDGFYCSHEGKGEKNGRMYYFQPININQKQIIITVSINSDIIAEIEKTGYVFDYIGNIENTISESIDFLTEKYRLKIKSKFQS